MLLRYSITVPVALRRHRGTARISSVVVAMASVVALGGCHNAPSGSGSAASSSHFDEPLVVARPADYNSTDLNFAKNVAANRRQYVAISTPVTGHSTNPSLPRFARTSSVAAQEDLQTLRALLWQWTETPGIAAGPDGGAPGAKGLVDQATIGRLDALCGSEFDTLWLQIALGLDLSALDMADAEINNGKNVDAVQLAKQIVTAERAEIKQIDQMKEQNDQ